MLVIDWEQPVNNDFLLVSQFSVTGALSICRPDLVGFVNGLPLVVIELKKPGVPTRAAFDENLTYYKAEIPQLFWFNAVLIASMLAIRQRSAGLRPAAASPGKNALDNPERTDMSDVLRLTEPRSSDSPDGVGVFWHTQGSGKSYSMVFFASGCCGRWRATGRSWS